MYVCMYEKKHCVCANIYVYVQVYATVVTHLFPQKKDTFIHNEICIYTQVYATVGTHLFREREETLCAAKGEEDCTKHFVNFTSSLYTMIQVCTYTYTYTYKYTFCQLHLLSLYHESGIYISVRNVRLARVYTLFYSNIVISVWREEVKV